MDQLGFRRYDRESIEKSIMNCDHKLPKGKFIITSVNDRYLIGYCKICGKSLKYDTLSNKWIDTK